MFTADMIAPCGLDCSLCKRALQREDPCPGCLGPDDRKPPFCSEKCGIVRCAARRENGWRFCDACPDFPCADVMEKETRYTSKYPRRESPLENLRASREGGMEAFLEKERAAWTCPSCGSPVCVHTGRCGGCGRVAALSLPETERLFLREMVPEDFGALYAVLGDAENTKHYPYAFDETRVRAWIDRNRERYRTLGFGLWAVCLKETGEMIGDCGLTLQPIRGEMLPEIGYHIRRDRQRRGYAREAASAVMDWAFAHTAYDVLYSYCKYTNTPSVRTAESVGMRFVTEYPDETNGITHVSAVTRDEWRALREER